MKTKRSSRSRDYPLLFATTAAAFCSGRSFALRNMVLAHGYDCVSKSESRIENVLIERLTPNRVQLMMSRARAILISLIPALALLVSLDCLSDSSPFCGCDEFGCSLSSAAHGKQGQPTADNALDQAVHRLSRRLNVQPGSAGGCSSRCTDPFAICAATSRRFQYLRSSHESGVSPGLAVLLAHGFRTSRPFVGFLICS
jgi:hypothetical protein